MTNIFVSINCDKEYHFNTIDEWLKNQKVCPFCKKEIS